MTGKRLNLEYITDVIGNEYKTWKKGDVVLIDAQTGTGKTTFILDVLANSIKSYERILYICNRTNLKRQLKKELLGMCEKQIPETLEELDAITTIGNITIATYHVLQYAALDEIYEGKKFDTDLYNYIVFDEAHYIMADSAFNNKCRFIYDKLIYKYYGNAIRIFISATMQEIKNPIERCFQKNNNNQKHMYEYSTGVDYSYVKPLFFESLDTICNLVMEDKTENKWLIFVSKIKDADYIKKKLTKDCSIIKSGTDSRELESIINNSYFEKKVLVCTKALDNGISLKDDKLTNIVIMAWDKITFIQMLGRKRVCIENPQEINLYLPVRNRKQFLNKLEGLNKKQKEIELFRDYTAFCKIYDNDLSKFSSVNDIFYRDFKTREYKINPIGHFRLIEDIESINEIIEGFNNCREDAFVRKQLSWLNKEYSRKVHTIDDYNDNITISKYLDSLIGQTLFNDKQTELKNFLKDKSKLSTPIKSAHKSLGYNLINKWLKNKGLEYSIESKKESKGEKRNKRYWTITKTNDLN